MADYSAVTIVVIEDDPSAPVTAYTLAGSVSTGPSVPTTGQIWPRGNS